MVLYGTITKGGNNMEENLTVADALKITVDLLGRIKVPVGLMNDVSVPINDARNNLIECIKAMEKPAEKEAEPDGREADVCE